MKIFSSIWAYIAVILPTIIGVGLVLTPNNFVTPDTAVTDLAITMGFRNLALSAVLLFALIKQSGKVICWLLLVRGLSEVGDGVAFFMTSKEIAAPVIVPLVLAALSFIAAKYFFSISEKKTNE